MPGNKTNKPEESAEKPSVTLPGTVEKVIPGAIPAQPPATTSSPTISVRDASAISASMLPMPITTAVPSQRKLNGAPATATPRRASSQAAAQPPMYRAAEASVESTASSAKVPVNASPIVSAA